LTRDCDFLLTQQEKSIISHLLKSAENHVLHWIGKAGPKPIFKISIFEWEMHVTDELNRFFIVNDYKSKAIK